MKGMEFNVLVGIIILLLLGMLGLKVLHQSKESLSYADVEAANKLYLSCKELLTNPSDPQTFVKSNLAETAKPFENLYTEIEQCNTFEKYRMCVENGESANIEIVCNLINSFGNACGEVCPEKFSECISGLLVFYEKNNLWFRFNTPCYKYMWVKEVANKWCNGKIGYVEIPQECSKS